MRKFKWRRWPKQSKLKYKSPVVCWHTTKKSVESPDGVLEYYEKEDDK